jgi:CheY-like chemotaxis protein
VVWNLLSNAIKFTPKDGKVHVLLRRINSQVEVSVVDTGIGITSEFLPHVFDRFRQADAKTTRAFGGLGLGLSIVRRLVEMHGGTVEAKSPGEGEGAAFTVRLPVSASYQQARYVTELERKTAESNAFDFQHADLHGVRVLVVDDESDTRELIARVLGECNADVMKASSAEQALAAFDQQPPDVMISDIGMPDVDGYELLKRVRARGTQHGGRTPAIALTAFARSEDRTRALRAGFLVHVSKPVEPSELVATVASVAGRT